MDHENKQINSKEHQIGKSTIGYNQRTLHKTNNVYKNVYNVYKDTNPSKFCKKQSLVINPIYQIFLL